MSEYIQTESPQQVAYGENLQLIDAIPCTRGYVVHRNGSGVLKLRGIVNGSGCFARYQVTFNGNIAIPTGGAVAPIAVGLAIDGETSRSSRAIATPVAADQYTNVTSTAIITVPKGCCHTVAVENVAAGVGTTTVAGQAILVADGNVTVSRIA